MKVSLSGSERKSYSLLGLDGECEDGVGATALSIHGGGGNSSVPPTSTQDLVGISGRADASFCQSIDVHPATHVLSQMYTQEMVKKV